MHIGCLSLCLTFVKTYNAYLLLLDGPTNVYVRTRNAIPLRQDAATIVVSNWNIDVPRNPNNVHVGHVTLKQEH